MMDPNITFYGFTPVARNPEIIFDGHSTANADQAPPTVLQVKDCPIPETKIVAQVREFIWVGQLFPYIKFQMVRPSL